jgi:hypothetical protein
MSFGDGTRRFTFYVRARHQTRNRPWRFVVHADETCARWRGSRSNIYDSSGLGDTLMDEAKDCANKFGGYPGVRLCSHCVRSSEQSSGRGLGAP